MLIAYRAICSLPIEPYAHYPSSHMLIVHRAICSLPIEPYAHCPSSHILIAHRTICSLSIEPYAHCLSSHMLVAHRTICSLPIEPYATFGGIFYYGWLVNVSHKRSSHGGGTYGATIFQVEDSHGRKSYFVT